MVALSRRVCRRPDGIRQSGAARRIGGPPQRFASDAATVAATSAASVSRGALRRGRHHGQAGRGWIVSQRLVDLDGSDVTGIYLVRPDGTGSHRLVPDLDGAQMHPAWSPDGEEVTFIQENPNGTKELWVVGADGTNARAVATCELALQQHDRARVARGRSGRDLRRARRRTREVHAVEARPGQRRDGRRRRARGRRDRRELAALARRRSRRRSSGTSSRTPSGRRSSSWTSRPARNAS